MDGNGRPQTGFKGPLYPGVIKRSMFAGKMNATFWLDDLIVKQGLLAGVEERERASRIGIIVPHVRGARLKLLSNLRVNNGHIFDGLLDLFVRQERAPAADFP